MQWAWGALEGHAGARVRAMATVFCGRSPARQIQGAWKGWGSGVVGAGSREARSGCAGLAPPRSSPRPPVPQVSVLNKYSEAIRGSLTKIMRLKIVALVTIEVHARDVLERLYKAGLMDVSSFDWLSQLRFYWDKVPGPRCHPRPPGAAGPGLVLLSVPSRLPRQDSSPRGQLIGPWKAAGGRLA